MTSTTVTTSQEFITNTTLDLCASRYEDFVWPNNNTVFCNWVFDSILCWPPTEAGKVAYQRCPPGKVTDTSKYAERRCEITGKWEVRGENPEGWTNYRPCYLPEVLVLLTKINKTGEGDLKLQIAERTRALEIIGFSLSLITLLISLAIFCRFRSLKNNRTRIHKNLFVAMVIQVLIRLTLYIDQAIIRDGGDKEILDDNTKHGIDNTPYLCEASYIMLEYARTAMFMWMFIEGLYLHNMVTVTVFQGRFPHTMYALLGWGGPIIMTAIWAGFTATRKSQNKCWWGYNLTPYYWILEGPRLAVILLNLIFLMNIIRILIVKLRQSHTSDLEQLRKSVRAAIVLLPLLGITNLLNMTEAPLDKSAFEFALWSYITHFLTSFQGFFIAMIYCFLNGEVRAALLKRVSVYLSLRGHHDWAFRRQSMFSGNYATAADTEPNNGNDMNRNPRQNTRKHRNWLSLCFFPRKDVPRSSTTDPPESIIFDISDN